MAHKQIKMKNALLFVICFLSMVKVFCQDPPKTIRTISADDFNVVMDSLQDEVLIDLRTPEEVKGGTIPGAMVIDYFGAGFDSSIQTLDRIKTYVLYCASGGRSGETAEIMHKLGFKKIYNFESGFNGWVKRKMPVRKP